MRGPLRRLYWVARPGENRRAFRYDRTLLVNEYLAEQESASHDLESAIALRLSVCDSLEFLAALRREVDRADFALLDGAHDAEHVVAEFELIHPLVRSCGGKVYCDNTSAGGVAEALRRIGAAHGGNLVEFANCSWAPPGNAVWQP
jgi:cephalosporin hydroxylase